MVKKKTVKKKVQKRAPRKKAAGRPTRYRAEYGRMAKKACELGATNDDLAELFGVTARTIENWSKRHPEEFFRPLKDGKAEADAKVVKSLFERACGYAHADTDIKVIKNKIVKTPLTKHYPPDTTACIFWLKNRMPESWRDRVESDGDLDGELAQAFAKLAMMLPN